ncbi:metal-dependent hydrolase [Actinomadura viridis]|uniref:Alanyl-tRNA synthetase n=1 Tax=Actinomadura viridis TaxID=58110 RepID=A0A931DSS7_9ACTN|nr:metal-dependent hydrolase [Actinomadura viridis]MBG6092033.1 alanyl-tRNA synthetase [Actinomadura viridis]
MRGVGGSTLVTFPAGAVWERSRVVGTAAMDGGCGVVTERTPFHPLDHTWPDQPADTGVLVVDELEFPVVDCLTGAVPLDGGDLRCGDDIPARRGDGGWAWVVVHVIERALPMGVPVDLRVDAERRRAFSEGHTACHLMALALNAALAPRWRKEVRAVDGLGRPDFDKLAITSSRIVARGSRDTYRIGSSLRRKGFDRDGLAGELPEIAERMNGLLATWVDADVPVRVVAPSSELAARRTWRCALPEGTVEMPCGGTHVASTGELGAVGVTLESSEEGLVIETKVCHCA